MSAVMAFVVEEIPTKKTPVQTFRCLVKILNEKIVTFVIIPIDVYFIPWTMKCLYLLYIISLLRMTVTDAPLWYVW